MEGLDSVFTGRVSLARVHPMGVVLMAAAVILTLVAAPVGARFPEEKRQRAINAMRVTAALVCCAGALLAILG